MLLTNKAITVTTPAIIEAVIGAFGFEFGGGTLDAVANDDVTDVVVDVVFVVDGTDVDEDTDITIYNNNVKITNKIVIVLFIISKKLDTFSPF